MKKIGVVYKIMEEKNFGFIRVEGERTDHFFHKDECVTNFYDLSPGRKVEFESVQGNKGPRAVGVELITNSGI